MRVLLVGAGGVGEAIVSIATKNDPDARWLERLIVCDYNVKRAERVVEESSDARLTAEKIDASEKAQIIALAKKYDVDFIMNALVEGADGVMVAACHEGNCKAERGNIYAGAIL